MSLAVAPLTDSFGRVHRNLRIAVTDRCNIRCFYCMPAEGIQFLPHQEILTFEEIAAFVQAVVTLGIDRLRITGGEPLVRRDLPTLVQLLSVIEGITDIALTTNGLLLADHVESLYNAGLRRINISLDTINQDIFERITRRPGLQKVLDGIQQAKKIGFEKIRINAVSLAGITEPEIVPLARFARRESLELRFIEFMPLDAEQNWTDQSVLTGAQVKKIIEQELGALEPAERPLPSQPAMDYIYADGGGRVGFINPVSEPFCQHCDRLRITAEGNLRNCLFSTEEWNILSLLRQQATAEQIQATVRECIAHKKRGHGIDSNEFQRPSRPMYQIGG